MNVRLALLLLGLGTVAASAQSKPKSPGKPVGAPAGYDQLEQTEFKVYYSAEVAGENRRSALKNPPLKALQDELKIVAAVVPAKILKDLQTKVPIWVEWDQKIAMGNGRGGNALALYRGGHQINIGQVNRNAVTILSLKSLAAEHQPDRDSGRCVTLHELAHAYHDKSLNDALKQRIHNVYKQAMERDLYDPYLYAATNEHEYFAELSCAYLQGLDYPPRTRAELQQLDKEGYKLMESVWGRMPVKKALPADDAGPDLPSPDGDGKFSLKITTAKVVPGNTLVGALPGKADWAGRPVVVVDFPVKDPVSLYLLRRLNDNLYVNLKDFGLIAFGAEGTKAKAPAVEAAARQRGITFPLVSETDFGIGGYRFPHAFVYNHTGQCIFRGHPIDAEPYVRMAVGEAILARLDKEPSTKSAREVVKLLKSGAPIRDVFTEIAKLYRQAPTKEAAAELENLRTVLLAGGQKAFDAAEKLKATDPVEAFYEAERLKVLYSGTSVGSKATDLSAKLFGNPKVDKEWHGKQELMKVTAAEKELRKQDLSFDPTSAKFKEKNKALLDKLDSTIKKLEKACPETWAAEEAGRVAERWDLRSK
jgi:hypothetical protein